MDPAKLYRVALPWEAPFAHSKQGDFSTPGEFVARSLNRHFISYVEDKIKSYQKTLSDPYWVFDAEDDTKWKELLEAYGMMGKNCLSSLVLALLDWQQRKLSKKIDMWEDFAKELNKAQAAQLQATYEERKMYTIYYVFCRLVLEVLPNADESDNPISGAAADELEKACFLYFEENKALVLVKAKKGEKEDMAVANRLHIYELFSQILGELCSQNRFGEIMKKLFDMLEATSSAKDLSTSLSAIYALRNVKMDISTNAKIVESAAFIKRVREEYFDPKAKKLKEELQAAFAELLGSILIPIVESKTEGTHTSSPSAIFVDIQSQKDVLADFYAIVSDFYDRIMTQYGKKKIKGREHVFYPLLTGLLCAAHVKFFEAKYYEMLDMLFKSLKEPKLKALALESIYHLLLKFLAVKDTKSFGEECAKLLDQLFIQPAKEKKKEKQLIQPGEECVDIIVDIITLLSVAKFDQTTHSVVLELIKDRASPDKVLVALLSFNAITDRLIPATEGRSGSSGSSSGGGKSSGGTLKGSGKQVGTIRTTMVVPRGQANPSLKRQAMRRFHAETEKIILDDFAKGMGMALDRIIADVHAQFGTLLLSDPKYNSKTVQELVGKDKAGQLAVAPLALSCLRRALPSEMPLHELVHTLAKYTLHVDNAIRNEAFQVLQHMAKCLPVLRATIVEQFCRVTSSIPDIYPQLIRKSLSKLSVLLKLWHDMESDRELKLELKQREDKSKSYIASGQLENVKSVVCPISEVDGTALLFLCHPLANVRELAWEVMKAVRHVNSVLPEETAVEETVLLANLIEANANKLAGAGDVDRNLITKRSFALKDGHSEEAAKELRLLGLSGSSNKLTTRRATDADWRSISDSVDVNSARGDSEGAYKAQPTSQGTLEEVVSLNKGLHKDDAQLRWARMLGALVPLCANEGTVSFALRHIVPRMAAAQAYLESTRNQKSVSPDFESQSLLWRNYAVAACAAYGSEGDVAEEVECTKPEAVFSSILGVLKTLPTLSPFLVLALSFVKSSFVPTLLDKLDPYNTEVYQNFKPSKGKQHQKDPQFVLRCQLGLVFRFTAENLQSPAMNPNLLNSYLDWMKQTRAYLDTVVGEWSDPLQGLRYDFFSVIARVVHHVHAGMPAKLAEVFPKQYRKKLFLFCSKYCGHAPKALTDKESPDANQLIKCADAESMEKARSLQYAALNAMGVLLRGGDFYKAEKSSDPRGPIAGLLTNMFKITDVQVNSIGESALDIYLESNAGHEDRFLTLCLDLCYDDDKQVSRGYFMAAGRAIIERQLGGSLPIPALLNLCLINLAHELHEVRELSQKLLQDITNNDKYCICPPTGVLDTSAALQYKISSLLAEDYPQLAFEVFSAAWHRITTTGIHGHAHMLFYLPPWLEAIDFAVLPSDATVSLLENLCTLTFKYGSFQPFLLERLWAQLVARYRANIASILQFIVQTILQTRNEQFLPTGRKIAVFLGRVDPVATIDLLIAGLYDTTQIKFADEERGDKEKEDSAEELSEKESEDGLGAGQSMERSASGSSNSKWEFSRIVTVDKKQEHALSSLEACMILLIELGVEHIVELCDHLQVVFHVLFLNLDSPNALIHRHARIFLANLVYSLTSGQVGKLERDSPAAKFLARIEALGDRRPWAYEDPTITALDIESAKQLGQWVAEVVTLLPSFTLLPSSWGAEALSWAAKIGRIPAHYVYRSFHVYRALLPLGCSLNEEAVAVILSILYKHEAKRPIDRIGLAIDIMHTFIVIIEATPAEELLKYHQIFWAITSVLYADYQQEFLYILSNRVLEAFFAKMDFSDPRIYQHFVANMPANREPAFTGLQPLLLKGLTSDFTAAETIQLLKQVALLPPENALVEVHPDPQHRYLTSLLGLAPWLMANYEKEAGTKLALDLAQILQKVQLQKFTDLLCNFAKSVFKTEKEFGKKLGSMIAKKFFPAEEMYAFSLLAEFLDIGPNVYKRYILDLMAGMTKAVKWKKSVLAKEDSPALFAVVGKQYGTERWRKALEVMDVVLNRNPTTVDIGRSEHVNVVERIGDFERASRTWQSLDKGKALVSNSLYQVVQNLPSLLAQQATGKPLPKPPTPRGFDDGRQPSFRKPSVSMD